MIADGPAQPMPTALAIRYGEEHLVRHQGALAMVGVQGSHGDPLLAARHQRDALQ